MGFYEDICHECLIKELKHEMNKNIVLFTIDGSATYGQIHHIEDKRVALIVAAPDIGSVQIRRPNGLIEVTTGAQLDLCTVVAKATGLTGSPFVLPG